MNVCKQAAKRQKQTYNNIQVKLTIMNKLRVKLISKFRTIMEGCAGVSGRCRCPRARRPPTPGTPPTGPMSCLRGRALCAAGGYLHLGFCHGYVSSFSPASNFGERTSPGTSACEAGVLYAPFHSTWPVLRGLAHATAGKVK